MPQVAESDVEVGQVKRIRQLFGDRLLVKRLEKPERSRGFYVPANYNKQKSRTEIWFGVVVGIGLDSTSPEAYDIKIGDLVGCDPVGADCLTIEEGSDFFCWVPDEFVAIRDLGLAREVYASKLGGK